MSLQVRHSRRSVIQAAGASAIAAAISGLPKPVQALADQELIVRANNDLTTLYVEGVGRDHYQFSLNPSHNNPYLSPDQQMAVSQLTVKGGVSLLLGEQDVTVHVDRNQMGRAPVIESFPSNNDVQIYGKNGGLVALMLHVSPHDLDTLKITAEPDSSDYRTYHFNVSIGGNSYNRFSLTGENLQLLPMIDSRSRIMQDVALEATAENRPLLPTSIPPLRLNMNGKQMDAGDLNQNLANLIESDRNRDQNVQSFKQNHIATMAALIGKVRSIQL